MYRKLLDISLVAVLLVSLSVGIWGVVRANNASKQVIALEHTIKARDAKGFDEASAVRGGDYQGVFLGDGQTYFGKITDTSAEYIVLSDVYYLGEGNQESLIKLGCEVHAPRDVMYILKDKVTFWENLKNDGDVAKAITDYKKANPRGQSCRS